jgi:hypothetical protein
MPFGSNTRRDLIDQVLYEMSLVASGQPAAPEDIAQVDRAIEPAVARYQALEILGDFDFDNVPDEFLTPVAIFVADTLLDQYGIPRGLEADPSAWNAKVKRAADEMRVMRAMRPTYAVLQVNYF